MNLNETIYDILKLIETIEFLSNKKNQQQFELKIRKLIFFIKINVFGLKI